MGFTLNIINDGNHPSDGSNGSNNNELAQNELDRRAMGGTELMGKMLEGSIDKELLSKFQIIRSRVRNIDPDRIPILWNHDLPEDPEAQHYTNKGDLDRFALNVFVSNWQMQQFNDKLGVPYERSLVIRNGILPFDSSSIVKPHPEARINIIYTPTPHRGLELLVPAFDALTRKYSSLIHLDVFSSFKLYGWEERDRQYADLFKFCEDHPNITYHGSQPNSVVRSYLEKSHIFAYPSIWKETFCLCAAEAMSAKNLVVCPNLAALPETTANIGCIYQYRESPSDHKEIFQQMLDDAIERLHSNPTGYDMFTSTSKNYADQFYNDKLFAVRWERALTSILAAQQS